ncbi:hypothetical protein CAEBREN_04843 [Caenorhabditis brenneri]|uniref:Uncharacterized protein n=1 Tax=Caenorhabditis brenneri TaxID=135651 RepID=G0NI53_CAEBE|nr:hypothetical protein CAEBREN_04843 [Caenorhabditis brenneri]
MGSKENTIHFVSLIQWLTHFESVNQISSSQSLKCTSRKKVSTELKMNGDVIPHFEPRKEDISGEQDITAIIRWEKLSSAGGSCRIEMWFTSQNSLMASSQVAGFSLSTESKSNKTEVMMNGNVIDHYTGKDGK